jgi:hypothetical protein
MDWNWARNNALAVTHGWKPEISFLLDRWAGYDEAIFLYVLGLGSLQSPLPKENYRAYTESFQWKNLYRVTFLYAGPLFIHHFPQVWLYQRGVQEEDGNVVC